MDVIRLHDLMAGRPGHGVQPVAAPLPAVSALQVDRVDIGQVRPARAPALPPTASVAPPPDAVNGAAASSSNPLAAFLADTTRALLSAVPLPQGLALLIPAMTRLDAVAEPPHVDPDTQPLRVYRRGDHGEAALADLSVMRVRSGATRAPHKFKRVGADDLEQKMKSLAWNRLSTLRHLDRARTGHRAVPKDCTLRPTAFDMSYDGALSARFIDQMASVGRREGFHVVARTGEGYEDELTGRLSQDAEPNVTVVPLPGAGDTWIEDHGEATTDNTITVPASVGDQDLIDAAILRDRVERLFGERLDPKLDSDDVADEVNERFPRANFARLGAVDDRSNQEALVGLAMSAGLKMRQNYSYIEGGNVLPGTLPNGDGYALVGKDSVAVTHALLERDLARRVTPDEVMLAISKDLGMKPQNVHPVEQPGTFHIDMAMGLLGPGQVLLNDSRESARLQGEWLRADAQACKPQTPPEDASFLRRWLFKLRNGIWKWRHLNPAERAAEALKKEAENRAWYEDHTAADLQKAGLEVHRAAAVFMNPYAPSEDVANFANIRQGTNPAGERFVIALGGERRAETYFAQKLLGDIPCGVQRVWFLNRDLTSQTLDLSGGIKCRSKGEGTVTPGPQPRVTA